MQRVASPPPVSQLLTLVGHQDLHSCAWVCQQGRRKQTDNQEDQTDQLLAGSD
jgi:hypothetical protein